MSSRLTGQCLSCLCAACLAAAPGCRSARTCRAVERDPDLQQRALSTLRQVLILGQGWPKVHAAECLLSLGCPDHIHQVFEQELAGHAGEPKYRIGIWRVLAQSASSRREREARVQAILTAFLDEQGPDRIHAAESLSKLRCALPAEAEQAALAAAGSHDTVLSAMATWLLAVNRTPHAGSTLVDFLTSPDADRRRIAAYGLRLEPSVSDETARRLTQAALAEPQDSPVRPYLMSAAFIHGRQVSEQRWIRDPLRGYVLAGSGPARYEAATALAIRGTRDDVPLLAGLIESPEPDDRVVGAYGVLRHKVHLAAGGARARENPHPRRPHGTSTPADPRGTTRRR